MLKEVRFSNRSDSINWKWFSVKTFSTKYCCRFLLDGGVRPPFSKIIWKNKFPPKVKYFLYHLSLLDKILTKTNLVKRGWQGKNSCSLCDSSIEIADHLFLQCPFSRKVRAFLQDNLHFRDLPQTQYLLWNNGRSEDLLDNGLATLLAMGLSCLWKE